MKVAIHQPHYLPWLGYFAKWASADLFVFLDTVQYEKNGWQNRNRIKTPAGPRWLTVPVRAHLGMAVGVVPIDTTQPWRARHLRAIENAYAKAPRWPRYRDELQRFYAREWGRLAPLAVDSARWLAGALGVSTPTRLASDLAVADGPRRDATARLVAICRAVGADTVPRGPGRRALPRRRPVRGRRDRGRDAALRASRVRPGTGEFTRFSRPLTYY